MKSKHISADLTYRGTHMGLANMLAGFVRRRGNLQSAENES